MRFTTTAESTIRALIAGVDEQPSRKDRINIAAGGASKTSICFLMDEAAARMYRDKGFSEGIVGIDQHANAHGPRLQLMQQPKLLCPKFSNDKRDTGDIAARPVETCDEAELNRVAALEKHDRYALGRLYCCDRARDRDHSHPMLDKLRCQGGQPIVLSLGKAKFDVQVFALDETGLFETLAER
jgi:hypothetical protein